MNRTISITASDVDRVGPLLSTALAGDRQKRLALIVAAAALIAFLAIVPFARVALVKMPAFIPAYEAALFFIDLVTAVLLFDQYIRVQSRGLLLLASAYLFEAFIIVPHALSFPDAFVPGGLLGSGAQTTAWLYIFWHGGFSAFVLGYALWGRLTPASRQPPRTMRQLLPAIILSVVLVAALTVVFVAIATWAHDRLPVVMQGGDYSLLVRKGVSPAVWVITLIAMVLLWRRQQRVMDLWLMLVMWIWLFDIALSAVIGANRFDLGFYAGRLFGLAASSFLLLALVVETIRLYSGALSGALDEVAKAEQKIASMRRTEDVSPRTRGSEPIENFVHRENIARYRAMLNSGTLDDKQRRTIERLLEDEERRPAGERDRP